MIAVSVSFVLTILVGKKKLQDAGNDMKKSGMVSEGNAKTASKKEAGTVLAGQDGMECNRKELKAFLTGEVIALKEVNDGVFSEGIMGDGIAIIPENDTLYAPIDATVSVLMQDSKHACGLTLDNGAEILLHVGIDTVDMNGDGFQYLVSEGQKVKEGTPLIQFDRAKIQTAGHPDTTVCIITEPAGMDIRFVTGGKGEAKETVVAVFE